MNDRITAEEWFRRYAPSHTGKLAEWRKARGLTQRQLAERLAMDVSMVSRIEQGRVMVRTKDLERFAEAMGVTVETLTSAPTDRR